MTVFSGSRRFARGGLLALALAALLPVVAQARPEPGARSRGFRLFARSLGAITINRVYLGLSSAKGNIGVDSTNSSTIGGGFWPRGTPNQFVFNSGLQVAGKIENPGGDWDGDISGAFFFDPKGTTEHGEEIQPIYNATNPSDVSSWPAAAVVRQNQTTDNLYNPVLLGLNSASQGDVWFMTWDGNPTLIAGRQHPLGVVVESRGLGWNYPAGNEDIVYFIFNFYNITSTNAADYATVRPEMRPILLQAAQEYKERNEAQFGITIPAGGYVIDSMFAAFAADMDVSNAGSNYCGVNLPFAMGYCYEHTFLQQGNEFYGDPTIWGAPFFAGPGFVGVKYLKSPTGAGAIQLFSNTVNSATGFRDAQNIDQLYRYLSGNVSTAAGDAACQFDPVNEHVCFINPVAADARFFQSSTPLRLLPGAYGTIVVAYIFAAPVAIPGFTPSSGTDVNASDPLVLTDVGALTSGAQTVDSLTGFNGFSDLNADLIPQQDEFTTIPGSLLGKALTAQEVFNIAFLLPFAPNSPQFYLVPGDNEVSIVWQPTVSETSGDPYFAVANDPGTPTEPNLLYDPNYRQFDVEGYRIYRGRVDNANALTMVAQYDYAGTSMADFTGQLQPTAQCGPEFGVTAGCPVPFDFVQGSGVAPTESVSYPLVGQFVQVKYGTASRVLLGNGDLLVIGNADTLMTGASSGDFPELNDGGIPFAYVDREVRNNFRYFYSVTAFDVNSFQSGPATLESPRITKAVTPRVDGANQENATLSFGVVDAAGNPVDVDRPFSIDPATGRFSGPPAATNTIAALFAPVVPALYPAVALTATIDSVMFRTGGLGQCGDFEGGLGQCAEVFASFDFNGTITRFATVTYAPVWDSFGDPTVAEATAGAQPIPADPDAQNRYGIPDGFTTFTAGVGLSQRQGIDFSSLEGQAARRGRLGPGNNLSAGGSRWFSGANETVDHPGIGIRMGHLDGVDTIWAPIHHTDTLPGNGAAQTFPNSGAMQCFSYGVGPMGRNADVRLTWGAGGQVASIEDVSNGVPVDFHTSPSAGYGFVADGDGDGMISWNDFDYIPVVADNNDYLGFCQARVTTTQFDLTAQPTIGPVTIDSRTGPRAPADIDGQGFGLYINGERYIFALTGGAAPAAGTVWTLRTYGGRVRATNPESATPSAYTISTLNRAAFVPGLRVQFNIASPTAVRAVSSFDLQRVHTVPDPYFVTNGYEATTDAKILQFVNLPNEAIIRIYTSSGILVNVLEHRSQTFGGSFNWNLRNRNNQVVASGVYFYHIESGDARKVGRFTVVNYAQ